VLLVAVGLAACGGGDDSASTAADAGSQGQSEGNGGSKQGDSDKKGDGKSRSGDGKGGSGGGKSGGSGSDSSDFKPRQHNDSGGGAQQFRQKGGDNSVQEFGEEAGGEEFDAAAVALHNFLDARAEGNWAAACGYMSKAIVESFEKLAAQSKIEASSCAEILENLTNPAAKKALKEEAEKANVGSLRVEGDRSFVIYTGIGGTVLAMPMANEDGDWKVASLAGTPLN
jgi:hypothetical protein